MTLSTKKDHKLVELFLSKQTDSNDSNPFKDLKTVAKSSLEATGFPTLKEEEYKYTNITKRIIDKIENYSSPQSIDNLAEIIKGNSLINTLDGYRLVRNNGVFDPELSNYKDAGFSVKAFSELDEEQASEIGSIESVDKDAFAALNAYSFESGIRIDIPDGLIVEQPIVLADFVNPDANGQCVQPRTYYHAGKIAKLLSSK